MTQTRWFCHSCAIEWIYAVDWAPEMGCPSCQSAQIERITYRPAWPGGDIPRGGSQTPSLPAPILAKVEPRALVLQQEDDELWAVPV